MIILMKENLLMIDIKSTEKNSGLQVYSYATDKFKSENISVWFCLPNVKKESVKRSLLLSVLKRGTEKYPSQKLINERLDELYATLLNIKNQKFENVQLLGISADIINSSYTEDNEDLFSGVLEVIDQIMFHPLKDKNGAFCEEYLKSEKENYKSIILSQINEPRTYAAIRCREEMFASLGIVDRLDTMCQRIEETSMQDIVDCYEDFINNAQIIAFYVGERTPVEVQHLLDNALSKRKVTLFCESNQETKLLCDLKEPKEIVEESDISQSRLIMGLNCSTTWKDEDYYAMLLCNEILGASPISKLMVNVRERLSICYECSSVYNSARGAIFITTGIDSDNYELAKSAILTEIEDIKNGNVSENEIFAAKKSIFNVYSAVCDSPSAIERFYLGRIINNIDIDIKHFLDKIDALSLADLQRAANKISLHTVYLLKGESAEEADYD